MAKKDEEKQEEQTPNSGKSLEDVTREVIDGKWGVGQERRLKLTEAGYNPREVEAEVVRLRNEPLTRRDANAEESEGRTGGAGPDDRIRGGTRATGTTGSTAGTSESGTKDVEDRGSSD